MKSFQILATLALALLLGLQLSVAQDQKIQNWRPYDQTGINVFEPAKDLTTPFNGLQVRVGGNFTQQFQGLSHSNNALDNGPGGANELYPLAPGFNLANANLNIDVQLADGIRISLENYMSSRHHAEFWVKGGYIQIDKLPMFGTPDWFSKYLRVKIGHFQVNYGDQQFRRSDNGNTMYNPFVGNYILDAFATEIGSEVYFFHPSGLMLMGGMTSGYIKGDITASENRSPSIYGKAAFDRQFNDDLRFRLSASTYFNDGVGRNTLYGGDRAGSRFYEVMNGVDGGTFTSGRLNPGFTSEVLSFQVNPFLKFHGLEIFGTYETSTGLSYRDPIADGATSPESRSVSQIGVEGIYRFLKNEQMYVGGRYNQFSGQIDPSLDNDVSANRLEVVAGWFPIPNLLMKVAYVNQDYVGFPETSNLHEGNFNGFMVEASVGF